MDGVWHWSGQCGQSAFRNFSNHSGALEPGGLRHSEQIDDDGVSLLISTSGEVDSGNSAVVGRLRK